MIYFITDGEYVKIGFTDKDDVQQRLSTLQTGNARELTLLGTMQGGRESEMLLHQVFSSLRVRGEWFLLTPQIKTVSEPRYSYISLTPTRKRILNAFRDQPDATITEIAGQLGVTRQAVSKQVKQMNGVLHEVRL